MMGAVARILIIGGEDSSVSCLTGSLEKEGHVAKAVAKADRGALEHVAIVCWLSEASPERFLLGAIDSSMRGFIYLASVSGGGSNRPTWEQSVLDAAARNAIPVAALTGDPRDLTGWLAEARAAIGAMLGYG